MWIIFKVLIELVIVLFYALVFGHKALGILAPQPGIESVPPALEGEVLTIGIPGSPPKGILLKPMSVLSLFCSSLSANFLSHQGTKTVLATVYKDLT